jgi:hypothetical protein
MNPPIFALASASADVTALLGLNPVRLYLFGEAEESTPKPYAVWQTVFGSPVNYLAGVPDDDSWGVQIDAYALTAEETRQVAMALRDAIEPYAYVVGWNGEFRERDTRLYRYSFTVEFITERVPAVS